MPSRYLQCNKMVKSALKVSWRGETGRQAMQLGKIATVEQQSIGFPRLDKSATQ